MADYVASSEVSDFGAGAIGTTAAVPTLPSTAVDNATLMGVAIDRGDVSSLTVANSGSTDTWVLHGTIESTGGTGNGATLAIYSCIRTTGQPVPGASITGAPFDDNWSTVAIEVETFDAADIEDAVSITANASADDPSGETLGASPATDSAVFGLLSHERRDITATPGTEIITVNPGSLYNCISICQYTDGSTGGGTWTTVDADDNVTGIIAINNDGGGPAPTRSRYVITG